MSTVDDLARWSDALESGKAVSAASRDRMFTPAVLAGGEHDGVSTRYGFGNGSGLDRRACRPRAWRRHPRLRLRSVARAGRRSAGRRAVEQHDRPAQPARSPDRRARARRTAAGGAHGRARSSGARCLRRRLSDAGAPRRAAGGDPRRRHAAPAGHRRRAERAPFARRRSLRDGRRSERGPLPARRRRHDRRRRGRRRRRPAVPVASHRRADPGRAHGREPTDDELRRLRRPLPAHARHAARRSRARATDCSPRSPASPSSRSSRRRRTASS